MRTTFVAVLALAASACAARQVATPPPTPVRLTVTEMAATILEKNLSGEGWVARVTEQSSRGQAALNADEQWDETTAWVTFTARRPDGGQTLLTPQESAAVLRGIRLDVRKMVTGYGGDPLDTTEGEAYRERWLLIPYKLGGVAGTARVTIGPATDKAEETANKLEIVVREQPVR